MVWCPGFEPRASAGHARRCTAGTLTFCYVITKNCPYIYGLNNEAVKNNYSLVSPAVLAAVVLSFDINIRGLGRSPSGRIHPQPRPIPLAAKSTAKARATNFAKKSRALNTEATATHKRSHDQHLGHGRATTQDDTVMMPCRNLLRSGLYPDLSRHRIRRAGEGRERRGKKRARCGCPCCCCVGAGEGGHSLV